MPRAPHNDPPPRWLKTKVSSWFWSLSPTCKEVARLTSRGFDHPLPLGIRLRIALHRAFCQWCTRYARQLGLVHEAARLLPEHIDQLGHPGLKSDSKARMKRALRGHS